MTDKKLARLCKSFRNGILDGGSSVLMCAAVSLPLCAYLSMLGVDTEYVLVDLGHVNHAFLRLPDGRVLDATADQFGDMKLPPVYIGPPLAIHENVTTLAVQSGPAEQTSAPRNQESA